MGRGCRRDDDRVGGVRVASMSGGAAGALDPRPPRHRAACLVVDRGRTGGDRPTAAGIGSHEGAQGGRRSPLVDGRGGVVLHVEDRLVLGCRGGCRRHTAFLFKASRSSRRLTSCMSDSVWPDWSPPSRPGPVAGSAAGRSGDRVRTMVGGRPRSPRQRLGAGGVGVDGRRLANAGRTAAPAPAARDLLLGPCRAGHDGAETGAGRCADSASASPAPRGRSCKRWPSGSRRERRTAVSS